MDFDRDDAWTGAFVVAAFLAVAALTVWLNHERFMAKTYPVAIHLTDISGVEKGAAVVYKGYTAGSVSGVTIEYRPDFRFVVSLSIQKEIRLPEGTKVLVRGKGFGGAKVLELVPPPGPDRGRIESGALLPVASDKDLLVKAGEVLSKVESVVQDLKTANTGAQLAEAIAEGRAVLTNLDSLLKNLDGMIAENRKGVGESVSRTRDLSGRAGEVLSENREALKSVLSRLDESLSHLPSVMINIEEFTAELKEHPWILVRKGTIKEPVKVDHAHPRPGADSKK